MNTTVNLSESRFAEIKKQLSGSRNIENQIRLAVINPEKIDFLQGPHSKLAIALICLLDAIDVARQTDYALLQARIHLSWYREECSDAPREDLACDYCKYYVDDSALRLYSSAEHVANFINNFMEIEQKQLDRYSKKHKSNANCVGHYLKQNEKAHQITLALNRLLKNQSWNKTIEYRNNWVHNQPPLIKRPGIVYERKSRWREVKKNSGAYFMGVGGDTWDKPDVTIDQILVIVSDAASAFEELLANLTRILFDKLIEIGMNLEWDVEKIKVSNTLSLNLINSLLPS